MTEDTLKLRLRWNIQIWVVFGADYRGAIRLFGRRPVFPESGPEYPDFPKFAVFWHFYRKWCSSCKPLPILMKLCVLLWLWVGIPSSKFHQKILIGSGDTASYVNILSFWHGHFFYVHRSISRKSRKKQKIFYVELHLYIPYLSAKFQQKKVPER